ncbi:MAG TPA: YihY/virulence factor BrkB family protein [Candidatus Limnocylindrales bacterium]|nr:YihY/virulence factor BrkB family protein [Candidatus Limnocylindrales bacterium]
MSVNTIGSILKDIFKEFNEDNVLRLSAALAYYAMFSIGPLLVIVVGVAGLAFGENSVRHNVEQQLQSILGQNAEKTITSMMAAQKHGTGLLTTILGVIALLFGAGGVFGQLQDALNTIWEVKPKPGTGIWGLVRTRFLSFTMVLGVGFLLLVSMVITTFLSAATGSLGEYLPIPAALAHILNATISFGVISLLFAMIFKYLPDVRIPFRKVWVGAIVTALLFTAGKYLLALYLGRESTASAYGAAGSVIVILMWVYYASVILFLGAEFTQVYAKRTGARVLPSQYAEPVTAEARAEQGIPHKEPSRQSNRPGQPQLQPALEPTARGSMPGAVIRRNPWQFVSLMLFAGLAGGLLLRMKSLREGLRLYASFQSRE